MQTVYSLLKAKKTLKIFDPRSGARRTFRLWSQTLLGHTSMSCPGHSKVMISNLTKTNSVITIYLLNH